MRKVALFMLLFIAGLSILRWIENPVPVDPVQASAESETTAREADSSSSSRSESSQVAVTRDESSSGDIEILVFGSTSYTKRVEKGPLRGRKLYHLESLDSRSLEGGYVELIDLTAIAYDAESGEELLKIRASRGRAAVVDLFEEDIILTDVELTLLRNAPVTPLTLRTPNLTCSLVGSHFKTDSRVEIEGQGLIAAGVGFEFEITGGILRFERDGLAEVVSGGGRKSTLTCDGALVIRRPVEPEGPVVLDASENAKLALSGGDPVELEADHLRVTGRAGSGESAQLGFERIDADGEVSLLIGGNRFSSERAAIELVGADSQFRAEMTGSPHGRFLFIREQIDGDQGAEGEQREPLSVRYSGQGPLVVNRREQVDFDLTGPAQLEWADAKLQATELVSGSFGSGADRAEFTAFGDVQIQRENSLLKTGEFHMRHERNLDGSSQLLATAAGPAIITGVADEQHSFRLTAGKQIEFAVEGELWRIPRAEEINLIVSGPKGFVARAQEVSGFSADPLALMAVGDILVTSEWGTVEGNRLVLRGLESMTIDGLPDQPAHLSSKRGEWFARHVERTGNRMVAEDVERASFHDALGQYELRCKRMVVEEREAIADSATGITRKGFWFLATGSVTGRADYGQEYLDIDCGNLEGEWVDHLRDGSFLYSDSTLEANVDVHCEFERGGSEFSLDSDAVILTRTDRGSEILTSGKLIATGNVEVLSRSDARLSGRGDRLEVDKLGRGKLIARPGRRVSAEGEMPGGRFPFTLTASQLQFSDTFLEAFQPEIEFQLGKSNGNQPDATYAHASADHLEAREDSLALDGNVHLTGVSDSNDTWILNSDRARIDVREAGIGGVLGSLGASGNVVFDLENTMHARGEEFLVKSAQLRVRVSGSPAQIRYGGLDIETDWIEYDLLIHAISTAKDSIFTPIIHSSTPPKMK